MGVRGTTGVRAIPGVKAINENNALRIIVCKTHDNYSDARCARPLSSISRETSGKANGRAKTSKNSNEEAARSDRANGASKRTSELVNGFSKLEHNVLNSKALAKP